MGRRESNEEIKTYAETPEPFGSPESGVFKLADGAFRLRAEVAGENAKSEKTGTYFGLDSVVSRKEVGKVSSHGDN